MAEAYIVQGHHRLSMLAAKVQAHRLDLHQQLPSPLEEEESDESDESDDNNNHLEFDRIIASQVEDTGTHAFDPCLAMS
jgi:hypothetical protein